MRTIAIDIDNVLNSFDETLVNAEFIYDKKYGLDQETFDKYVGWIKSEVPKEEVSNNRIITLHSLLHSEIYRTAKVKPGAAEFLQWLKSEGWQVVIMTYRRLNVAFEVTKEWLKLNNIPYDYLFSTDNKVVMCNLWKIPYLIEDNLIEILTGAEFGVTVFYPVMDKHKDIKTMGGYNEFAEVQQWIMCA